ncbi:hypothetical protein CEXT_519161 [Caerostris extrusa]|uniref:Uncharacterized protein n=1 Tax=Caerostris extrusa TaxID=172846 RepID=A0AAV4REN1_CAEEX|nr:hypothetical protein CEXT_519161 [Caerostris extrusa]
MRWSKHSHPGMIEAAVSRKNMWRVRVAAVPLGRSGCPSVLPGAPPCPGGEGTGGVQRTRVDDSPPLNTSSQTGFCVWGCADMARRTEIRPYKVDTIVGGM